MASGHRKRYAALFRTYVSDVAGYNGSITAAEQIGQIANQRNLSIYGSGSYSPTFTNGSTTALSDAVSNADGAFTIAGLTGEKTNVGAFTGISMSGALGHTANAKHYFFPRVGTAGTDLSSSGAPNSPVIIYSGEGPQASYVPYYLGGTAATASIRFGSQITGAGSPTHVVVYVGGELASGDKIRILKASDGSIFKSNAPIMTGSDVTTGSTGTTIVTDTNLSSALYRKAIFLTKADIGTAGGLVVEFSSSAKTSTTPVKGVFVVISSGSY